MPRSLFLTAATIAVTACSAATQSVQVSLGSFGPMRSAGDVNADGAPDIALGDGRILSGTNGLPLHLFAGVGDLIGDIDADGHADVATLDSIYSGRDGASLYAGFVGSAAMGDDNGDGFDDFATLEGTTISIRSGRDGATLRAFANPGLTLLLRAAGDVDGDGVHDLLDDGLTVSGRDGSILIDHRALGSGGAILSATPAGDVDGDGADDVLIAADTSIAASSILRVYSPSRTTVLFAIQNYGAPPTTLRDGRIGPVGDVDRDGFDDFALIDNNTATIYSGRDARLLDAIPNALRVSANGFDDIDFDGFPELLIETTSGVQVFDASSNGQPGWAQVYGTPCLGGFMRMPRIGWSGDTRFGTLLSVTLRGSNPSLGAALVFGQATSIGLGAIGVAPCTLYSDGVEGSIIVTTDASGSAQIDIAIPNTPTVVGRRINLQWGISDPNAGYTFPIALSDALSATFGR